MGKRVISQPAEIKFEIWRVTFLKRILPLRNYWMDFQFSENNGNVACEALMKQGIGYIAHKRDKCMKHMAIQSGIDGSVPRRMSRGVYNHISTCSFRCSVF